MEYLYNFLHKTDNCIPKVNYEDVKISINNPSYLLINTLPNHEQSCLIYDTINFANEEQIINNLLHNNKMHNIIVYGRNCNDISVYKKYKQFSELGFSNVYIYLGGLFEWLLLQDIYGRDIFKTTSKELDIIKYKPLGILEKKRINY
jgi:hypothetical protein